MSAITLITDVKALAAAIKSIKGRSATLDQDIHVAACSAIAHFASCGDVGYINRLYLALGKGARHVALTSWLIAFGGVKANTGSEKDVTPFLKDKDKAVNVEDGMASPWYDFKPSPTPDKVVDILALVLAIGKRAGKEGAEVKNGDLLTRLNKLVAEYTSELESAKVAEEEPTPAN